MTGVRLSVLVFLLVFLSGMTVVLWVRTPMKKQKKHPEPRRTEAVNRRLPPLKRPDEKTRTTSSDSWEFTGETDTNFVTAKAKFSAELMH